LALDGDEHHHVTRPFHPPSFYEPPQGLRTAKVVLPGIFKAEEILMPGDTSEYSSYDCPLVALLVEGPFSDCDDILEVLLDIEQHVHWGSSRGVFYYPPHHFDGSPVPFPLLQFFAFVLKKYFKVRLSWVENHLGNVHLRWHPFDEQS
jgi:hypothetical protein